MNLNNSKIEDLVYLLKDCDYKNFNHFILVSIQGDVFVEKTQNKKKPFPNFSNYNNNILFWTEIYFRDRGYFGEKAVSGYESIEELYNDLLQNWRIKLIGQIEKRKLYEYHINAL